MVNRWLAAENFRRVSAILLACCLLFNFHSVSATRFSDPVNPISPEVPLRLKTLEQCVENGTSVAIVPESEQTCPCTLFVGDGSSAPIEGDYLVVRKDEYEAWENSGSGTTLFADVKVEIISPDPTKLRRRIEIPNEGKHVLVVRTKAKSSQCVELNYMFAAKERKFCPTRMNAETSLGSEKGIRHSIIAGTSQVDDIIQNFMVGVYTDGRGACTGSVVGKNWVLTAAHCAPEANSTRIFVGGDYFSSGNEHVVNEVFLHPEFSSGAGPDGQISSAVVNDIALLRTEHSIDVVPIGINNNVKIPQDRDIVRAVGYGLTFSSAQRGSLNSVDVSEVPMPECQEDYKEVSGGVDLNGLNEHEHICAGPDEVCDGGVCRGDSGGPLMVKRGKNYVQVGITSFGLDCQYKLFAPDVFARVSTHTKWIEEVTAEDVLSIDGSQAEVDPGNKTKIFESRLRASRLRRRTVWYGVGGGIAIFLLISFGIGVYFFVKWRDSTGGK